MKLKVGIVVLCSMLLVGCGSQTKQVPVETTSSIQECDKKPKICPNGEVMMRKVANNCLFDTCKNDLPSADEKQTVTLPGTVVENTDNYTVDIYAYNLKFLEPLLDKTAKSNDPDLGMVSEVGLKLKEETRVDWNMWKDKKVLVTGSLQTISGNQKILEVDKVEALGE